MFSVSNFFKYLQIKQLLVSCVMCYIYVPHP